MATRYSLRTRAQAPDAPVSRANNKGASTQSVHGTAETPLESLTSDSEQGYNSAPPVTSPKRSYTEAVSRSPSPLVERENVVSLETTNKNNLQSIASPARGAEGAVPKGNTRPTVEEDGTSWTTVTGRRPRSTASSRRYGENRKKAHTGVSVPSAREVLSQSQRQTVDAAEAALTNTERSRVQEREHMVGISENPATAGPSRPKGKGVDPKNWGATGIEESDLDIDTQSKPGI
ncbi:hypothetical protein OE88DRAFT_1737053 [Heliocybe sulcata]|uniref:Uncharacterized protein n=1 Tax=Heliocybe sulcata TaxID=5364 RepID=A0A5C3N6P5_9AGAM|nr:hypothetical protein OE88DRAFT_1737053 [Heliocybe sulcata]